MKLSRPIELGKGRQLSEIKLESLKAKHFKLIPKELVGMAFDNKKLEDIRDKLKIEEQKNGEGDIKIIEELKEKIEQGERAISINTFELLPETYPLLASLSGQKIKIIGELETEDLVKLISELFDALGGVI